MGKWGAAPQMKGYSSDGASKWRKIQSIIAPGKNSSVRPGDIQDGFLAKLILNSAYITGLVPRKNPWENGNILWMLQSNLGVSVKTGT